jgi:drug/metabolite transporter (DMT)-like permease
MPCKSSASGSETLNERSAKSRLLGVLLVLLSGMAIAIVPTSAKLAFDAGANTLTVVTLRGVVGMALMALFMAVTSQSFRLPERALAPCAAAGLAHALVAYGFIGSVAHIPVNLAVLVYATHPILLALIFHLQGRECLTPRKLALAFTVLAGLAFVLAGGLDEPDATGLALAALASLAVCVVILLGARAQRAGATSTQVNLVMIAVATIVCGAAATAGGVWSLPAGAVGWLGLAGAGGGVTVGLVAFFAAFRFIGAVRATMLSNVEPLLGVLFAVVVLGEKLSSLQWSGVALAVAALVLFEASPSRRGAAPDMV